MDRVARRGPLVRAPGALKGGHFRICLHFCRSLRGFVAKHQKIEKGEIFIFGKNLSAEKKLKGETRWDFPTSILSQNSKTIEGGPFGEKTFPKKVSQCRNWKGGPFVLSGYGMVREKTGKTFLVQFARPNSAI